MKRIFSTLFVVVVASGLSGCAICCTPFDYAYSAYGGRWQRGDMYHGRVGSAFSPAGSVVTEATAPVVSEGPILAPQYGMPSPTPAQHGPTLAPGY